ncbi:MULTISPECIES: hypothetical protein [Brevibacterium]|uniref:hypothetical protein n=1 Tax=Brevibacterium TaxID=1696 RepID=UPI001EF3E7A1|nr:hypothetical protein [Brevibacterium sp. ACRRH]MCG7299492.1 hypothetical protein [Brevibacterium sp. ACRRH]
MAETPRTKSHLSQIRSWWKTLSDDHFIALDPPTTDRYTQGHLHEDAAEAKAQHDLPQDISYAGWHWQTHSRAFTKKGELLEPLHIHWGGDRETVRAHLNNLPDGWKLTGGETDTQSFQLDLNIPRGLPAFTDHSATYRLLDRLKREIQDLDQRENREDPLEDHNIPPATQKWLHDLLAHTISARQTEEDPTDHTTDITDSLLTVMLQTALFTRDELDQLTTKPYPIANSTTLLEALLEAQHPNARDYADELGDEAIRVLEHHPNAITLSILKDLAPTNHSALGDYITVRAHVENAQDTDAQGTNAPDIVAAALATIDEMPPDSWTHLRRSVVATAVSDWFTDQMGESFYPRWNLGTLRTVTDERLPVEFRAPAARKAQTLLNALDVAPHLAPADPAGWQPAAHDARQILPQLLEQSPPWLNGGRYVLDDSYAEFTTVDATHETWLRDALTQPDRTITAYAFILGTLVDHDLGTTQDIDTCTPLWRKTLTKKDDYRWVFRHPMVALTDLCIRHDHPLLKKLLTWWDKATPKWKHGLKPLVELMTHTPSTHAEAVDRFRTVPYGEATHQFFTQYVLSRARDRGTDPRTEALELVEDPAFTALKLSADREHILMSVVVPEQPLWGFDHHQALDRALRVLEDPDSPQAFIDAALYTLNTPHVKSDYDATHLERVQLRGIPLALRRQRALEKFGDG